MNEETYRRRPTWQQAKWRICDRRPDSGGAGTRPANQTTWNRIRWNIPKPYLLMVFGALIAAAALHGGIARADVGGQQISPGNCPYPAVGPFGFDGVAEHYACDYPTEINGSHHRCIFGGAATSVVAGVNVLAFNVGVVQPTGVLEGQCYWSCPDGSMAAEPNPVGTWQGSSTQTTPVPRTPCKAIAPNPFVQPEQP